MTFKYFLGIRDRINYVQESFTESILQFFLISPQSGKSMIENTVILSQIHSSNFQDTT